MLIGSFLGGCCGIGLVILLCHFWVGNELISRSVKPYINDLPGQAKLVKRNAVWSEIFQNLSNSKQVSLGARLAQAGLDIDEVGFRKQQAVWAVSGFGISAGLVLALTYSSPIRGLPLLICCLGIGLISGLFRENYLTWQINHREVEIQNELPAIAELLALAIAAGESPVQAMGRVLKRANGAMAIDLRRVLAEINTGVPIVIAFDNYSLRAKNQAVVRFAQAISIAIDRGTPLADVLHAQAADVRESHRRTLLESGAKREVLMMIPVVFLILPVTVLFAFWPGFIGIKLTIW